MPRVLIVGATGVLRPAALEYLRRGWTVLAVARDPVRLAELAAVGGAALRPVSLDIFDATGVTAAVTAEPLRGGADRSLLYVAGHDDTAENATVDRLQAIVTGPTLRILTSRWWPAGLENPAMARRHGSAPPAAGSQRRRRLALSGRDLRRRRRSRIRHHLAGRPAHGIGNGQPA